MYDWKRRGSYETITDVIFGRKHVTEEDILYPETDPYIWKLDEAATLIRNCLEEKMDISIVGDYDCDGMMAASILKLYFEEAGVKPYVRLPRRFSEGYGLSTKIIDEIESGLVITVDNGIRASEAVKKAKEKGLLVVVTDHHEGSMEDISADVVVDPHMKEDSFSAYINYCGASLAYRLGKAVFPKSRLHKKAEVLAGIATVADVVPLIGDNRNIVRNSLKMLNAMIVPKGMRLLLEEIGKEHFDEGDYGFTLGPIMNASGRLLDNGPNDIVRLVTTDRELRSNPALRTEMELLVKELISRNETRKELAKRYQEEAKGIIDSLKLNEKDNFLVLRISDCPEGIIGIIAGRVAEDYQRPCIIFSDSSVPGVLKGSGRTAGGVHLKKALDECADLILKYGGHAGAAGLSIAEENLVHLRNALNKTMERLDFTVGDGELRYDLEITEKDIWTMLKEQEIYAPFGEGNRKPVFLIKGYELLPDPTTGEWVRYLGKDKTTMKFTGRRSTCIGFDIASTYEAMGSPKTMDILGTLSFSYIRGRKYAQVEIIDCVAIDKHMDKKTAALESLFF